MTLSFTVLIKSLPSINSLLSQIAFPLLASEVMRLRKKRSKKRLKVNKNLMRRGDRVVNRKFRLFPFSHTKNPPISGDFKMLESNKTYKPLAALALSILARNFLDSAVSFDFGVLSKYRSNPPFFSMVLRPLFVIRKVTGDSKISL